MRAIVEQKENRAVETAQCPYSELIEAAVIDPVLRAERRSAFPLGAALRLATLEGHESGIEAQDALQSTEPITWFDEIDTWLVTSRALVEEVLGDHERFSVRARPSFVLNVLGDHMLARDGEEQRYHRAPFDPSFRLRPVREAYTDLVAGLAESLLNDLEPAGRAELRREFASPFAVAVSGRALGLAFDDIEAIGITYDEFARRMVDYSQDLEVTHEGSVELDRTIQRNLDRIRAEPEPSVLATVLSRAGTPLHRSDEEIIANVRILLFGAIETVTSIILSTTWSLLTHPEQARAVRNDPRLVSAAVNEALRWVSPVGHTERWATEDTTLGGVAVRRGEMVLPSLGAANRDPAFFDEPHRFDISRPNARHHLAFGKGRHHCIGLNLGQLEATVAVDLLFSRLPGLRPDTDDFPAPQGFGFRSPPSMTATWDV